MPAHHHPPDGCDGCRRTQEILSEMVSEKLYKDAYFKGVEEVVRSSEADPAVKEHRGQGTNKQYFVDYMKVHPELWDGYFVEALNAAYEKIENENQSSA